ncbi:MAG: hypothetical protein H6937_01530 [Burkholderiales bacterium]|nr:hypothetical protein [Burkholderiales bacterium]MDR4518176.1 hypothetical protein [Nitrosomonas sp.]
MSRSVFEQEDSGVTKVFSQFMMMLGKSVSLNRESPIDWIKQAGVISYLS